MKKIKFQSFLLVALIATTAAVLLPGCKTPPTPQQQQTIGDLVELKAQIATSGALWYRPQLLPAFQLAQSQLAALAATGTINVTNLTDVFGGINLAGNLPRIIQGDVTDLLNFIGKQGNAAGGNQAVLKLIAQRAAVGMGHGITRATAP